VAFVGKNPIAKGHSMNEMQQGTISEGIINILGYVIAAKKGDRPKEDVLQGLANSVIETVTAHTIKAAEMSENKHLIPDIKNKSNEILNTLSDQNKDGVARRSLSFLVNIANYAAREVGGEDLKEFLNRDIKSFFKTKSESKFVSAGSEIGGLIGAAAPLPMPMGQYIGQEIGEFVASMMEYMDNTFGINYSYKKLLKETEFTKNNIAMLAEYGVRQEKIYDAIEKIFTMIGEKDREFIERVRQNEQVKAKMNEAIDKL
jgi:hypothetical protein